jgi:hypothetical protein
MDNPTILFYVGQVFCLRVVDDVQLSTLLQQTTQQITICFYTFILNVSDWEVHECAIQSIE